MCSIRDKWVSGDIFWRKITKTVHAALVERLNERREEVGGQPLKKGGQRSHHGKKRGPADQTRGGRRAGAERARGGEGWGGRGGRFECGGWEQKEYREDGDGGDFNSGGGFNGSDFKVKAHDKEDEAVEGSWPQPSFHAACCSGFTKCRGGAVGIPRRPSLLVPSANPIFPVPQFIPGEFTELPEDLLNNLTATLQSFGTDFDFPMPALAPPFPSLQPEVEYGSLWAPAQASVSAVFGEHRIPLDPRENLPSRPGLGAKKRKATESLNDGLSAKHPRVVVVADSDGGLKCGAPAARGGDPRALTGVRSGDQRISTLSITGIPIGMPGDTRHISGLGGQGGPSQPSDRNKEPKGSKWCLCGLTKYSKCRGSDNASIRVHDMVIFVAQFKKIVRNKPKIAQEPSFAGNLEATLYSNYLGGSGTHSMHPAPLATLRDPAHLDGVIAGQLAVAAVHSDSALRALLPASLQARIKVAHAGSTHLPLGSGPNYVGSGDLGHRESESPISLFSRLSSSMTEDIDSVYLGNPGHTRYSAGTQSGVRIPVYSPAPQKAAWVHPSLAGMLTPDPVKCNPATFPEISADWSKILSTIVQMRTAPIQEDPGLYPRRLDPVSARSAHFLAEPISSGWDFWRIYYLRTGAEARSGRLD
ncbi:hypothetical protein GGX14DRAFT_596236 [Mycena pura]|uniref:Uncharacterized protein n=1 Tax=Mycena pura TaxID=153505 RepID=A0AAD6UQ52_9AGAR|nr:hypothetical protein GGX14DRAFT_596236 [Mycena pura]